MAIDPTRTVSLRKTFALAGKVRYRNAALQMRTTFHGLDLNSIPTYGMEHESIESIVKRGYAYAGDASAYQAYILRAYSRGIGRSYDEVARRKNKKNNPDARNMFALGLAQSSLVLDQVKGRMQNDLNQINNDEAAKLIRALSTTGLTKAALNKAVNMSTRKAGDRFTVLVSDIVVASHAEAQLDGLAALGISQVTPLVEALAAQDSRVCPECVRLRGLRFTIEKARGKLPLHPRCRCCWSIP